MKAQTLRVIVIAEIIFLATSAGALYLFWPDLDTNLAKLEFFSRIFVLCNGFVGTLIFGVIAVLHTFYSLRYLWQAVKARSPEVKLFDRRLLYNPFNVVLFPEYLTASGLEARQQAFKHEKLVLLFSIAALILGFLSNVAISI